ncbi:protein kinase, putative [Trichomonas vaginalis G3]|uniref:Protein kinase, putative n=1 Tax=Trichomonas vaginalis (strain ATCC PRA-98 / G3) TaxID=412133 RepID=A2FYJ2_TRIV3|nr:protein kinase, putative [Trichomonas vaginalis G3]|eukprot:XP_001302947.1 protein kinase [Trichomonas vaginalis G3]
MTSSSSDMAVALRMSHSLLPLLLILSMALLYLHSNHEIHRDIRSGNILFNAHGQAKLSDFGLATSLIQNGQKRSAAVSMYGDACYMAPEMLTNNTGYTEKTDIWGLGLVLIELATGKMPYAGMKFMESMASIITKEPPTLSKDKHSSLICDFVNLCLNTNPKKRASAEDLADHKFPKTSRGSGAIATTILSQLAPLEQRYKILYENKTEQKMQKEKSFEKMEFDFFEGDNPNSGEKSPRSDDKNNDSDKESLDRVETHGRFTITRVGSCSDSKEMLGESPPPEKKKNPATEAISSQIRLLKFEIQSLESENEFISDRIHQIAMALQQIKASRGENE